MCQNFIGEFQAVLSILYILSRELGGALREFKTKLLKNKKQSSHFGDNLSRIKESV